METDFVVKTLEFEGPFEVLLEMIERRKLHISSVSLSKVADDFINHINNHESFPLKDSADFIIIASTLLLIKSKSLLPNLEFSSEEEASIENLEERLRQYKIYKDLALNLSKNNRGKMYFPLEKKQRNKIFAPTNEITLTGLESAISRAIENLPILKTIPKTVVSTVISLEDMIELLSKRIVSSIKTSFRDFSGIGKSEKVDVIVSFLAMLELVKNGVIRVNQELHFADIDMEPEKIGVPKY